MSSKDKDLTQQVVVQMLPDYLSKYDRRDLKLWADQYGTPLVIIDEQRVQKQYEDISLALPKVQLHYAIKALPDRRLIKKLYQLGCGFDVATSGEIKLLIDEKIPAKSCIHTHPIKKTSEIEKALHYGCRIFVVDNTMEIDKFVDYKDKVELMVRINFRNQDAVVDLSRKFGCQLERLPNLLSHAKKSGVDIIGLSFHVGSQVPSPCAHVNAIETCLDIIKQAPEVGWKILDIGGGFPIAYTGPVMNIVDFCEPIREALNKVPEPICIMAEPGRFIAGPSVIGLFSIIGKAQRGARTWYYLDDGVYGSFSGQIYDHAKYPIIPLHKFEADMALKPSVLTGPTCDSVDIIDEDIELPDMQIGDLLVATQIGAYSVASATEFNSYSKPLVLWNNGSQLLK